MVSASGADAMALEAPGAPGAAGPLPSAAAAPPGADPLAALPESLAAAVYALLRPRDLASMAQVCRAWRARYPWAGLLALRLSPGFPAAEALPKCGALRRLDVPTNRGEAWHAALAVLRAQRLPALTSLCLEHWAGDSPAMLDALADAMRVQGPGCRVSLAVTDREALAALSPRLPLPGLAHLDFNLAYLPEGAADAIAAAGQLASRPEAAGGAAQAPAVTVGVWVCCWGGCLGLPLPSAEALRAALGPRCVALESVNCGGGAGDLARVAALAPGLTSLGFNLEGARPDGGPLRLGAVAAAAGPGLRRLTLHGSSPAGWADEGGGDAGGGGGGSPFRRLSGLTRLALARDWGPAPLPLAPLLPPPLCASLVDVTVQRRYLAARGELRALGALTRLTELALALDAEPWELRAPRLGRRAFVAGGCRAAPGGEAAVAMGSLQLADGGGPPAAEAGAAAAAAAAAAPPRAAGAPLVPSPSDADLSWLRGLRCLRVATLEVPLLDLSWLPPSLQALDAAKFSDAGATWVRCGRCGGAGGCGAAAGGAAPLLPALTQLTLPGVGDAGEEEGEEGGEGEEGKEEEEEEEEEAEEGSSCGGGSGRSSASRAPGTGGGGGGGGRARRAPPAPSLEQQLLRCIAVHAPRLETLNLGSWQVCAPAAADAVAKMQPHLRRFTLAAAAGGAERAEVARLICASASRDFTLALLDPPIPLYPFGSVVVQE